MSVAQRIEAKLTRAFSPLTLKVVDESHRHAGHAGAKPEGETHFHVTLVAEQFAGMSRIQRHQTVHRVLKEELAGPVHALSLTLSAPGEV